MKGLIHKTGRPRRTGRPARRFNRRGRWAIRLAAGLCLASAVMLLTSCPRPPKPLPIPRGPPGAPVTARPPVPVVRVCLSARPLDHAAVHTGGAYVVQLDGRTVLGAAGALDAQVLFRQGRWFLNSGDLGAGGTLSIVPVKSAVRYEGTTYRGWLNLVAMDGGFIVVNHVDLEEYLAGVLSRELYPSWAPATYEALAVAARTYAIYQVKTLGRSRAYDLGSDQGSQVYGGVSGETHRSRQAVAATYGLVLTCQEGGRQQVFKAQYSACCGGLTNPAEMLRDAPRVAPLAGGQACDDCSGCRYYRWGTVRVSKADLADALAGMFPAASQWGGISWVQVESATPAGRPIWLIVHGRSGQGLRLRAQELRLAMLHSGHDGLPRLPSMNCRIRDAGAYIEFTDGGGYGHGVGLCQWGAQGKALRGWNYRQILSFYYPSSALLQAY